MKKIDQFKQLLEIQESLGGAVDLVSPTRELIKEGKIVKISARSGDHQERYLFLVCPATLRLLRLRAFLKNHSPSQLVRETLPFFLLLLNFKITKFLASSILFYFLLLNDFQNITSRKSLETLVTNMRLCFTIFSLRICCCCALLDSSRTE